MQRQSLGSPVSKLHGHAGDDVLMVKEDPKRRLLPDVDDDDERKGSKPRRLSFQQSPSPSLSLPSPPKPEKFIHLIPILTLFCFLILYLSSHTPSQSDLVQFNRFSHSRELIDSTELGNELRRGDVLAIRSVRNLRELEKPLVKFRPHRKVADF